jgi:hypothetical protein
MERGARGSMLLRTDGAKYCPRECQRIELFNYETWKSEPLKPTIR